MSDRKKWIIAGVAAVCFIIGVALSHRIEAGVRVQKVTLAGETPALKFIPARPGAHPVALLAHGSPAAKETLFRYGEALAAAGFICYSVDIPGYGASPRPYTFLDTVHTLEAVAHEVGPVDVFLGDSMGGFWGGETVQEGGIRPELFIALGSNPVLGDHAPPLLLLAGEFEEPFPPAVLKARTDARLVISPWSDHILELWDPLLVNTAVQAACVAVHLAPSPPPTAWRWRLIGAVLAMLAAGKLAICLTDLFPQSARFLGLFIAVFVVIAFMLTLGGRWVDAMPHLRALPKQGIAMAATFLLATMAGRFRIPRWSFAALGVLVMMIAVCWLKVSGSQAAVRFVLFTVISLTPALIAGTLIGDIAARRGSRLQGDIAMAIIVGCVAFQWIEFPRMAPDAPESHTAINLDAKLLDACVGQYEFPPGNDFWLGAKLTIYRQGDQLMWQFARKRSLNVSDVYHESLQIYPESETNFFFKPNSPRELTFVKNDRREVAAVILHYPGIPDREGKAVLAAGTDDAAVSAPGQPLPWIRTSPDKTHFVCDGTDHPFVPWGFNYDRDDSGTLLEDYWADNWAKIVVDFQQMKSYGANVVRIHLQLCRFMKSPEQPDENNLARLRKLVQLAEETGVHLDVTGLGCYHKQDVPAWYDAMDESARWKVQARFWHAVAEVCKDSPAIFCYDLMNEPIPSGDQKGDWLPGQPLGGSYFVQRLTTDMRGRTDREVAKEWIAQLSAAIRAVDQRHMITVGLVPWEELFGPGAKNAFRDPDVSAGLDFLCVHYYPRQGKLDEDLALLKLYDTGKPLVMEEIYPLSADIGTTEEFVRRSKSDAEGWISFYWGKTPEEYDGESGPQGAVVGNWLRHFCALRGELMGGAPAASSPSSRPVIAPVF